MYEAHHIIAHDIEGGHMWGRFETAWRAMCNRDCNHITAVYTLSLYLQAVLNYLSGLCAVRWEGGGNGACMTCCCVDHCGWCRKHRRMATTYESASTRQFALSRTETIRTQSPECLAFCKAMCDHSTDVSVETTLRCFMAVCLTRIYPPPASLPLPRPSTTHHPFWIYPPPASLPLPRPPPPTIPFASSSTLTTCWCS